MGSPPEDDDLREALRGVKPLQDPRRVDLRRPRPVPYPRQTRLDEQATLRESLGPVLPEEAMDTGEELLFVRPGVSRQTLRKMRRGHWVVEAQLDLHGMDRHTALSETSEFLKKARHGRLRCVRIVHGKGLGVLKAKLRRWLPRKEEVLAFTQAPATQGGSGALLVLLRA